MPTLIKKNFQFLIDQELPITVKNQKPQLIYPEFLDLSLIYSTNFLILFLTKPH